MTRRTIFDKEKAEARAHILEGLLIALDHIDEVIRIIRNSQTDAEAQAELMAKFKLSERQSQAILDMRLRRLTGLERDKIQSEYDDLVALIADLTDILAETRTCGDHHQGRIGRSQTQVWRCSPNRVDDRRSPFS